MKSGLAVFLFLLLSIIGQAQQFGQLVDAQTQKGIANASVYYLQLETGQITNHLGFFEIHESLPENATLLVSALGYASKQIALSEVSANDTMIIMLKPTHVGLHEVTISASTGLVQQYQISSVEQKSMAELLSIPSPQLADALTRIPGIYNQSTGTGIGKPVVRGLSGMRVVTYLNGLRIENQQWGGDHGMGLTELGIGKVEIIKGPNSLMYGADALGGVVHFTDEPYAAENQIEGFAQSKFESNSLNYTNSFGFKIAKNHVRFNLFAGQSHAQDYRLPNSQFVTNSRFKTQTIKASLGFHKTNWVMNLRYNLLNGRIGIPGHTHDEITSIESFVSKTQSGEKSIPAQLITNHYLLLENRFYFNNSDLKFWVGRTFGSLTEHDEKWTIPGVNMDLRNTVYHARYTAKLAKPVTFLAGVQGMFQNNQNLSNATQILIPDVKMQDHGAYALLNGKHSTISWQAGLRYDLRNVKSNISPISSIVFNDNYAGLNGSAGIIKQWQQLSIRANASTGFRPPYINELLSNGVHHAAFIYELGDADLKPEFATQFDLNIGFDTEHIGVSFNPFLSIINDFIMLQPTDSVIDQKPVFAYKREPTAKLQGAEAKLHWHPHFAHQLHFEHGISIIYGSDNKGAALPQIPQTRFSSHVKWEFKLKGKFHLKHFDIEHNYLLAQNHVSVNETPSNAYQLLNM
ncbi:MAG: TonB-dependent receptor, partial [Bacteroidetes bacterium]|nr:TonB-dependent receptor [Bacteroidota bacterium]